MSMQIRGSRAFTGPPHGDALAAGSSAPDSATGTVHHDCDPPHTRASAPMEPRKEHTVPGSKTSHVCTVARALLQKAQVFLRIHSALCHDLPFRYVQIVPYESLAHPSEQLSIVPLLQISASTHVEGKNFRTHGK
jgi:hypothetical protein